MLVTHRLDKIFAALSDPIRRTIIAELGQRRHSLKTISQLAKPFAISMAAISKHIDVLESSGLLRRRRGGRNVYCVLNYQALRLGEQWFGPCMKIWTARRKNMENGA